MIWPSRSQLPLPVPSALLDAAPGVGIVPAARSAPGLRRRCSRSPASRPTVALLIGTRRDPFSQNTVPPIDGAGGPSTECTRRSLDDAPLLGFDVGERHGVGFESGATDHVERAVARQVGGVDLLFGDHPRFVQRQVARCGVPCTPAVSLSAAATGVPPGHDIVTPRSGESIGSISTASGGIAGLYTRPVMVGYGSASMLPMVIGSTHPPARRTSCSVRRRHRRRQGRALGRCAPGSRAASWNRGCRCDTCPARGCRAVSATARSTCRPGARRSGSRPGSPAVDRC